MGSKATTDRHERPRTQPLSETEQHELAQAVATCDYTTARSASGPVLISWLQRMGVITIQRPGEAGYKPGGIRYHVELPESLVRQVHRWRHEGSWTDFYSADKLCVALGLHVSMVPPEAWSPFSAKQRGELPGAEVARAVIELALAEAA
jgi:hypothetical protein